MSVRPNVQSLELKGGELTVKGESPAPRFEALHVVVVQKGTRKGGVVAAEGEPLKDSLNWTAILTDVAGFTVGEEAETLGVEIRVDPFQVTTWSQTMQIE